jgi:transposase-like protein
MDMIYMSGAETCKFCQSQNTTKFGKRAGIQRFVCKDCGHHFHENGVGFARMRVNEHVIVAALNLHFDGLSTRKVQAQITDILGEQVSQSTVWYWVQKYSRMVSEYVKELQPKLSGKYHHDETALKVGGEDRWFWETIDEDTRFMVAHLLTETRTTEEAKKVFAQALAIQRPIALFTDGSFAYDEAVRKVFYTRYRANQVEWIRRVGIRARETNNIIERTHGTLKDRLKPMRGLKHDATARNWLDGYIVNFNYCRVHQSIGKTPAQEAGIEVKGWTQLIQGAQARKTRRETKEGQVIVVGVRN